MLAKVSQVLCTNTASSLLLNIFLLMHLKNSSPTQLQCCPGSSCSLNQILFPLSPSMSLNTRALFPILYVTYIFCSLMYALSFGFYVVQGKGIFLSNIIQQRWSFSITYHSLVVSKFDQTIDEEVEKEELTFQRHLFVHPVVR